MSNFCKSKSYSHFVSKNISVYAIFNDQGFNDTLTNDIFNFEQLGPDLNILLVHFKILFILRVFIRHFYVLVSADMIY